MMFVKQQRKRAANALGIIAKIILAGVLPMFFMASSAKAITIEYTAQNISGNTWSYSYFLSGNAFSQFQGFQIYFDYNFYSNLDPFPAAPNADWAPISVEPDSMLPANGIYDAIALVSNPSLLDPFVISFDWTGSGQPSSQSFSLYSCNDELCSNGFTYGQSGRTVARSTIGNNPVPEPITTSLLALGLLGMAFVRRYR